MKTSSVSRSDVGRVRKGNEDAILADDAAGLYVVCDGMGGASGGEVASTLALETVRSALDPAPAEDSSVDRLREVAAEAVRAANRAVWSSADDDPDLAGMGSTLSLLAFVGDRAVVAHVGDSRVYLLRAGRLELVTEDHTGVKEMVRSGLMTEEEANRSPLANILTRAVGTGPEVLPDVLVLDVLAGDRFLLCSDGLTRYVDMTSGLQAHLESDLASVAERLVTLANEGGGRDNISVIVVEVDGSPRPERQQAIRARMASLASAFGYQEIPVPTLQRILNTARTRHVEAGDEIHPRTLTCVVDGRLESEAGAVEPGDAVGHALLLEPGASAEAVVATAPTELLEVDQGDFWRLLRRRPLWGLGLLRRLAATSVKDTD